MIRHEHVCCSCKSLQELSNVENVNDNFFSQKCELTDKKNLHKYLNKKKLANAVILFFHRQHLLNGTFNLKSYGIF